MSKILMPDGTSNIPIEQVIALVAQDSNELASLQASSFMRLSTSSTFNNATEVASPTAIFPLVSPRNAMQPNLLLSSPRAPTIFARRLSLFEMHAMGYG
ncbi:hypothetical protein CPB84DRAFT_1805090 [Gymnopilus junonius]|nr:hypothetical protein CPB84DRAFT_1805090 [Gymnopilus junonius]